VEGAYNNVFLGKMIEGGPGILCQVKCCFYATGWIPTGERNGKGLAQEGRVLKGGGSQNHGERMEIRQKDTDQGNQ